MSSLNSKALLLAGVMLAACSSTKGNVIAASAWGDNLRYLDDRKGSSVEVVAKRGKDGATVTILGNTYNHPVVPGFPHAILSHPNHTYVYVDCEPGATGRIVLFSPWEGMAKEFTVSLEEAAPDQQARRDFLRLCEILRRQGQPLMEVEVENADRGAQDMPVPWARWIRFRWTDAGLGTNDQARWLDFDLTRNSFALHEEASPPAPPPTTSLAFPDESNYLRTYYDNPRLMGIYDGKGQNSAKIATANESAGRLAQRLGLWHTTHSFACNSVRVEHGWRRASPISYWTKTEIPGETYTHPAYWNSNPLQVYGEGLRYLYVDNEPDVAGRIILADPIAGTRRALEIPLAGKAASPALEASRQAFKTLCEDACQIREPLIRVTQAKGPVQLTWSGKRNNGRSESLSYKVTLDFDKQSLEVQEAK